MGVGMKDVAAIAQLPSVRAVAPATVERSFQAAAGKMNWNTQVTGSTPTLFDIRDWTFAEGGPFTEDDVKSGRLVAVIGATLAGKLFPQETAQGTSVLGRSIHINGTAFRIVGVLEPKGAGFNGRDQDDVLFVPITTARNRLWEQSSLGGVVQMIVAQAVSKEALDQAAEEIGTVLREHRRLHGGMQDDFSIHNMGALTQTASETTRALTMLLGAIASISLIVGGIGIMNIMLVTVAERTREIGIRKAIGAAERQILLQFLTEAVMITLAGSLIGIGIGLGGGLAAQHWFALPVAYSLWPVLLILIISSGIGLASGIYPAYKAAKMTL
jgi:putative ABC transport system permease protein